MYKYIGCENLFRNEEGNLYALEFESPVDYKTEILAEGDETSLRFERQGIDVLLIVYSKSWEMVGQNDKGRMITRSIPGGERLKEISYEEFSKNPANKIRRYIPPYESGGDRFVTENISFYELFPNLKEGEQVYINQSSVYYTVNKNNVRTGQNKQR